MAENKFEVTLKQITLDTAPSTGMSQNEEWVWFLGKEVSPQRTTLACKLFVPAKEKDMVKKVAKIFADGKAVRFAGSLNVAYRNNTTYLNYYVSKVIGSEEIKPTKK